MNREGPTTVSDRDILGRCRQGDAGAWVELYGRHAPTTNRFLLRLLGPTADIDDLVQQVFTELVVSLDRYRGDASFTTWLYGIASHVACDHVHGESLWKRRKIEYTDRCLPDPAASPDPADGAMARDVLARVDGCLAAMRLPMRTVWVMHEVEGMNCQAIGTALGIGTVTARVRLFRARREIVDALIEAGLDRADLALPPADRKAAGNP
jgi:RNA polymerase sigma-70 factor, ECF subfamily